jgi:hypothetical protein
MSFKHELTSSKPLTGLLGPSSSLDTTALGILRRCRNQKWRRLSGRRPKRSCKRTLTLSSRLVGILCEIRQQLKEFVRLSDEQAHRRQKLDYSHSDSPSFGRTNDRTLREFAAEEWARLRHDQVCLEGLATKGRRVEVRKGQSIRGVSKGRRIARLVRPRLKVHGFSRTNADENP